MERFSMKRQSILNCLMETREHPSAEWIHSKLKAQYPSLSLATVYRNLNQLRVEGLIRSVGNVNGQERFDANIKEHTHIVCIKCGRVMDAFEVVLPENINEEVEKLTGCKVLRAELTVSGVCKECRKKEGEKASE